MADLMMVKINYLAVVACGVSNMVLGFLWYGPLFGKTWMGYLGWSPDRIGRIKKEINMGVNYGVSTVGALITAYVLAHFLQYARAASLPHGLMTAFWAWLGFMLPVMIGSVLWERKPWGYLALNAGYQLVAVAVMSIILTAWK